MGLFQFVDGVWCTGVSSGLMGYDVCAVWCVGVSCRFGVLALPFFFWDWILVFLIFPVILLVQGREWVSSNPVPTGVIWSPGAAGGRLKLLLSKPFGLPHCLRVL